MELTVPRIVMIGAGSAGFCMNLVQSILYLDTLQDAEFVLMDIDADRLNLVKRVMDRFAMQEELSCSFSATTDLTEALCDADFAISMIQVGGLEPYKLDTLVFTETGCVNLA